LIPSSANIFLRLDTFDHPLPGFAAKWDKEAEREPYVVGNFEPGAEAARN